jgi:membrane protein implicated in regulation of membrane protease activity
VLSATAAQVALELGPWLWMVFALALMALEIISGRGIALSMALGAAIAGMLAIFGASGVWPATSIPVQTLVFAGGALAIFIIIKATIKLV